MEEYYTKIINILSKRSITILILCGIICALGYTGFTTYSYIQDKQQNQQSVNDRLIFEANNKITKSLPVSTPKYTISYEVKGNDPVIITITCDSAYFRNQAIQLLKSKDPDVTLHHKIVFYDYMQPLKKQGGDQ